ncbi:mitochondrial genome maintenance protein [Phlyctochytrium arcticum]|nr:mitochondrial genome maintenance protein [Phlyctochytrium arcticum]
MLYKVIPTCARGATRSSSTFSRQILRQSTRLYASQVPPTPSPAPEKPSARGGAFPNASAFENEVYASSNDGGPSNDGTPQPAFMNDPDYHDLTNSHKGLSFEPFPKEIADVLLAPLPEKDIEIKPDGLLYLPEIKYRRILNRAFGPGGWGLIPRGPHTVNKKNISREYALFCLGRFVGQARGEQDYFSEDKLPTASEGVKSNALMRCCKDLGIASELWDPVFIDEFKSKHCIQLPTVSGYSNTRKLLWRRKDRSFGAGVKEEPSAAAPPSGGGYASGGGGGYRKSPQSNYSR